MPTSVNYDTVPYEDCALTESHPDYLCIVGRLFGLETVSPDASRVLELGCASGGNIIPMAYYWPKSEFIGIELSEKQSAQGNQIIEDLQLNNIRIVNENILSLDDSLGTFDYIIAHGVYSWVPKEVQEALLDTVSNLLNANGLAYISYNTYPGWYFKNAVRDMMYYRARHTDNPQDKINKGIEMLKLLYNGIPDECSLSEKWVKEEARQQLKMTPSYLLHDPLEDNNSPVYFHDFMKKVDQFDLQYLADANLYTMLGSTLSEQANEILDTIEDLVEYEQYMDFFYVRHFRQSVLCKNSIEVDRDMDMDLVQDCYICSILSCNEEIDLDSTQPQVFQDQTGTEFDISHPLTKVAIVELAQIYPNSYSYGELVNRSQSILSVYGSEMANDDPDELLTELFNLYLSRGIRLSVVQRNFDSNLAEFPKASPLAQIYGQLNRCCIASVHHNSILMDEVSNYLLSLLTGENTLEDIVSDVIVKSEHDPVFRRQMDQKFLLGENFAVDDVTAKIERQLYHLLSHGLIQNYL